MPSAFPTLPSPSAAALALAGAAALLVAACIDRSNPFDPVNQRGPKPDLIREALRPSLEALRREGDSLARALEGYQAGYLSDSASQAAARGGNDSIRARNESLRGANASTEASNRAVSRPDSLQDLASYGSLKILAGFGPYADFPARSTRSLFVATRAAGLMDSVNSENPPPPIYSQGYRDSLLAPLRAASEGYLRLQAVLDEAGRAVADSNLVLAAYNHGIDSLNRAVLRYNDSLAFLRLTRSNPPIVNADTLKANLATAKPGDTLIVGAGTFPVELTFASGTPENPIVLRGAPNRATVLVAEKDGSGVTKQNVAIVQVQSHVRLENLVFRGGATSGLKLEGGSQGIVVRDCLFDSNGTWGVEALDSDLDMEDCEVRANGGGGIRVSGAATASVSIRIHNVLVARNGGHGISLVSQQGQISNSTIVGNRGSGGGEADGIHVESPLRSLTLSNNIIALNQNFGIYRQPTPVNQEGFSVRQCDIWGNQFPFDLRQMDSSRVADIRRSNLEVEPKFTAPEAFDYSLVPGSELAEYENLPLPVVIGYRRRR